MFFLQFQKKNNKFDFYNEERIINSKKHLTNDIALKLFFLIHNNFWVHYFLDKFEYLEFLEDNWIDFEKEISNFVIEVNENKGDVVSKYKYYISESTYTQSRKVIEILDYDLKRFILLLEIYLCVYIQNMNCEKLLKDVAELDVEHVISFNYTNTYERLYGYNKEINYDYIHGKADINNTIESNNMVLGIDEYLPDDRKDKETEFIAFKKYYQRIYKGTGSKYREWVDEIYLENANYNERIAKINKDIEKNNQIYKESILFNELDDLKKNPPRHNLYIFGHSLDVTDKDVLRNLILNDNVYTTIFYHSKEELGKKIANLVKVIGQDELIRRTGGSTKTIKFQPQQEMVQVEK